MKLRTRIWIIVIAALSGIMIMGAGGLYQLRQSMMQERRAQIVQLLDLAKAQLTHYQELEASGKLSREEAQNRAIEALASQRAGNTYFFIRSMTDDTFVFHIDPKRVGKPDQGAKSPDGRTAVQVIRDGLAQSKDGKAFALTFTARPGSEDKTPYPKLNGVIQFEPWGWIPGTGFYLDDIDRLFWNSAIKMLVAVAVILAVMGALAMATMRSILGQLGGEPQDAADIALSIANGDLSQRIDTRAGNHSLIGSMRSMQQGLHDMVRRFNQASSTLANASEQLNKETAQISRGSQMTSEATSSTAAAIEEMTVSISHISSSARETELNSHQAAELATEGEKMAQHAADEIRRISGDISSAAELIRGLVDRSREIDSMSAVIKEIADQTNLLALNAAIEAARAGEQGRGFAVVADEVRKLAERTSGATQDITRTIRAVQDDTDIAAGSMDLVQSQVAQGVDLVEKAAAALREINGMARVTLEKTRDVANATQEQSQVSNSIAGNVERIAQMVEESDASVQAAHEQVRSLDELARELTLEAAKFKL
ncbi:methyl-accepting chemotaxis protein [Iodobacter sp. HSC-16F04]|uniref:Methyl-accepting chemotaxis protein n=1 Tax=Iodobacter violaceini TaxID=3044271 RepID=A0ABX0KKH2_9NEIS|nr:methyl-accepting chemotaxis protein [Iodobacter violacea]NHQ84521.1 methyl-accepting chemotaxis protein [Iodobacter violacea]